MSDPIFPPTPPVDLLGLLRCRADQTPDRIPFRFGTSLDHATSLSYGELDRRARQIAVHLSNMDFAGQRIVLYFPAGPEFLCAYWGCLYAGAIAIPTKVMHPRREPVQLRGILKNAEPAAVLGNADSLDALRSQAARDDWSTDVCLLNIDQCDESDADRWSAPDIRGDWPAMLQYTSGSTSSPRGVIVSHANLVTNIEAIARCFGISSETRAVTWLPHYHDMGLIGGLLVPMSSGVESLVMSPMDFLGRPVNWLRALTETKATVTGAPNFAYDLCVRAINDEDCASLDLSHLRLAFNGAEPIRADVIDRFCERFAACGFRREAMYPCYGLAEATLLVAGAQAGQGSIIQRFDDERLRAGTIQVSNDEVHQRLVSSGQPVFEQTLVIVDPDTCQPCDADEIGEIWVSGPCVAAGYWNSPSRTEESFASQLEGDTAKYFRTGDLGFLQNGQLFVTGRAKDVIIIRGQNHYPQDVEATVNDCHEALAPGGGAAFSISVDGSEQLAVVHEIQREHRTVDPSTIIDAVREAISRNHDLQVHGVLLLRPGQLPRTSSGKVQRSTCRDKYLAGSFKTVGQMDNSSFEKAEGLAIRPVGQESLIEWLQSAIAQRIKADNETIDIDQSFAFFGLDSVAIVSIAGQLEERLHQNLSPTILYEYSTIRTLAAHLVDAADSKPRTLNAPAEAPSAKSWPSEIALSDIQRRLWFLGELASAPGILNIPVVLDIDGPLDPSVAQQALSQLVRNHTALRTTFHASHDQIVQSIGPPRPVALRLIDLRPYSDSQRAALAEQELRQAAEERFDPSLAPMMRATLLRLANQRHQLAVTISHLISDGWSMGVLCHEFVAAYQAICQGQSPPNVEAKTQFASLLTADGVPPSSKNGDSGPQAFRDPPAVLELPCDHPRATMPSFEGDQLEFEFPTEVTEALFEFSRQLGVTPFVTLLSGFQTLLYRYTGQKDITVGVPFSGRNQAALREVVGPLMNPLPIRVELSHEEDIAELVSRTRTAVVQAQKHQEASSHAIAEQLDEPRSVGRPRFYQVMFDMQDEVPTLTAENGLVIKPAEANNGAAMVDLALSIRRAGDRLRGHVQFDRELFEPTTIERLIRHYTTLLSSLVENTDEPLAKLSLLAQDERQQLLVDWNATEVSYSPDRVDEMFARQVNQRGDSIAVVCGDEQLTYRQLNDRSNALAQMLVEQGVRAGDLVGILLDRSLDVAVALLGVLKAGAAYVPVDPTYPPARQQLILDDATVRCVISSRQNADRIPDNIWQVLLNTSTLDDQANPVNHGGSSEDLAYVLYTSGSTGKPKGVMVTHRNLANFFVGMDALQSSPEPGVWLAVTSISFDISVFELLWTLSRGYTVVILTDPLAAAIDHSENSIAHQIEHHGVTHFQCTPPLMRMLIDDADARQALSTVKKIFIGGDAMPQDLARELTEQMAGDVYNMYGPTETTIWSTTEQLVSGVDVTIGRPITNTQVYVVDRNFQPLPVGVPGELLIGGDGVTRGYYNKPDLTADRFISDPFRSRTRESSDLCAGPKSHDSGYLSRLYRTGDLVRTLDDGRLEFLGRIDHQTKIRGHRIELGDIETTLQSHALVKEAVVVVSGDDEHTKRLVAFVVPSNGKIDPAHLQSHLRDHLPPYMIPSSIVPVESLQLTPNGKIDRKTLASLSTAPTQSIAMNNTPSNDDFASQLAALISDELAIPSVETSANLLELGVSSMEIARVANRMERDLGWRPSFADFFRNGTIDQLAQSRFPTTNGNGHPPTYGSPQLQPQDEFEEGVI